MYVCNSVDRLMHNLTHASQQYASTQIVCFMCHPVSTGT